jgi:CheY-like chemotaxis protein
VVEAPGQLHQLLVDDAKNVQTVQLRELAAVPPADSRPSAPLDSVPRPGAVLLVDDDLAVLGASRRMLQRLGHEVIAVSGGAEAIAAFQANPDGIGSVVLDLSMPKMGGWELLAALRKLRADTYVVVASGYDLAGLRQERRAVQPDAWLQKPFSAKELAAALPAVKAPD